MTVEFGAAAVRLCGLAARLLGWRPAEFWTATPTELAAALRGGLDGEAAGIGGADLRALMEQLPDG